MGFHYILNPPRIATVIMFDVALQHRTIIIPLKPLVKYPSPEIVKERFFAEA